MLNNIFLDAEFEKKITEMTIEAIEANDIGASLVPLQVLLYINSVKAFGSDVNSLSTISTQLSSIDTKLQSMDTKLQSIDASLKSIDKKTV